MNKTTYLCFILMLPILSLKLNAFMENTPQIIYGSDDRIEAPSNYSFPSISNPLSSVALVLPKKNIHKTSRLRYKKIAAKPIKKERKYCKGERFRDQKSAGFCTGFLISQDTLITAGHCVESKKSCKDLAFLFEYKEKKSLRRSKSTKVLSKNLYDCKEILFLGQEYSSKKPDLAIIKLNRRVLSSFPFKLSSRKPRDNADFFVPGHPLGLPMKVVTSGKIIDNEKELSFTASVDTYGGNSGSPIVNKATGLVDGLLVRGGKDFDLVDGCYKSHKCTGPLCHGETFLRSSYIKTFLRGLF